MMLRTRPTIRSLLTILSLLPLLLASGCASFDRKWNNASEATNPVHDLTGRWAGTWQNTNNDHSGQLKAVITQESPTNAHARFHATWGRRSGSFVSNLDGLWIGERFIFNSKRRILLVKITTEGFATAGTFQANYHSRFDTGTFTLQRLSIPD